MSLTISTLASASYITTNGSTTVTYSFKAPGEVLTNVLNSNLSTSTPIPGIQVSRRITNPGVFTAGTAQEGTASNPTNDSNS